jgi:hypothetical protein
MFINIKLLSGILSLEVDINEKEKKNKVKTIKQALGQNFNVNPLRVKLIDPREYADDETEEDYAAVINEPFWKMRDWILEKNEKINWEGLSIKYYIFFYSIKRRKIILIVPLDL